MLEQFLDNEEASQEEVDKASNDLELAIANLEEIAKADDEKPTTGEGEEVIIKPDPDNTVDKEENNKEDLPQTGAVVSSTIIVVLAIGIIAVGGTMFIKKRKRNVE